MNAILAENVFGILEKMEIMRTAPFTISVFDHLDRGDVCFIKIPLESEHHYIVFPAVSTCLLPYQLGSWEVIEVDRDNNGNTQTRHLDPPTLMWLLSSLAAEKKGISYPNLEPFIADLQLAEEQTSLSMEAYRNYVSNRRPALSRFIDAEQWSSFRDRPFHPTSRIKRGWDAEEYRTYGAEFHQTLTMKWVAVRRDYVLSGQTVPEQSPDGYLLSPNEQEQITGAMERCGISRNDYVAFPVHPWQMKSVLLREFGQEFSNQICVPLPVQIGDYVPTSSVRSLAPMHGGEDHLKLPLGIVSLGAVRYLPALYMINGEKAQRLLEEAKRSDPHLAERLHLCDETKWWAYHPHEADFFDDRPRHLSCLIRNYPQTFMADDSVQCLPMSAFAVVDPERTFHILDDLLVNQGDVEKDQIVTFFKQVCDRFFCVVLRLLRCGILPEIHGQNVMLVIKHGRIEGLLLRDLDTTRLYLPWVTQAGLQDPGYIVNANRANSLYNSTPEELLFYLQSLGIQVNLCSIMDACSQRYRISEWDLWDVLKESLEFHVKGAGFTEPQRILIEDILFHRETWPYKLCITPLLEQQGGAVGSMPSGKGTLTNPFLIVGELMR
ncbi:MULTISPECIES: IucA/IucC family protein [unclassified Paenibacillus]|uniref:IucA/IucC family protein n=1 Tax=unclassified Paenibacillus TaxID=185978 RepID=UPI002785227B|nr:MULTISPECIES: IucA/IucC family protein [unclassified Paenibacillus]MDQ0897335.1 siderophore synthetase component [Paenibacillus sp. V4I7]MDQ0916522.1 siderophore synthetase component [Paenibacillus sp. V4I5]